MPRGLIAGSTDYSHQTFEDMMLDLNEWIENLHNVQTLFNENIKKLKEVDYWKKVDCSFQSLVYYSLKFFITAESEISAISKEIQSEVKPHHIARIRKLYVTSAELDDDFGRIWHREYKDKEYGEEYFDLVEDLYGEGRDMAVDMRDLSNLVGRLEDFIGRTGDIEGQYNIAEILDALWILECEETCKQGTAFSLAEVGIITCDHVLGNNTYAFKPVKPSEKFSVSVLARNEAIDIAVLNIDATQNNELIQASADKLSQMDQIAIAGFPNYRLGDSGILIPGKVIGFRPVSGILRILTNAPIVAGNSGGPVLDTQSRVIGIAVTGSDRMEDAQETENHGIIPIDALTFLGLPSK